MDRLEKVVSIKELFDFMKEEGYVWAKQSDLKTESLKEKYLRKKNLTYKEIADAEIWGDIKKKAVEAIAKKQIQDHEKFLKGNSYRVHISAVQRIGQNRGTI